MSAGRRRHPLRRSTAAVACAIGIGLAVPAGASEGLPRGSETVSLDPARFTTDIDNEYWPMQPGTRWTYHETDRTDVLEVVVVVTDTTKRVANGIRARVVRDTVRRNGEIVEDTFDWYAQDRAGNVWYLGEDTAEFHDGEVTSRVGSWEAGVDGALPGIAVPAHPRPGMRYRQEYAAGRAEDNGAVLSTDEMADVPHGHFTELLLTKDTNALEPKVLEYKFYAKRVGPILTLDVSGGSGREELVERQPRATRDGLGPAWLADRVTAASEGADSGHGRL